MGALGALLFNVLVMPYLLTDPYFENVKFIKDFKNGKITVNPVQQIYVQENNAMQDAIQKVERSIVAIQSTKLGIKSGLILTSDGLVVTLANAVSLDGDFKVFLAGQSVDFKVVKTDSKNNLVLIKLPKNNLPTVGFADQDKIKLGQSVFLVAPTLQGQDNWLANVGIIREIDQDSVKTNISESQAAAGSPLFNSAGELIGLNFIDSEGKISAVSINKIQNLLGL